MNHRREVGRCWQWLEEDLGREKKVVEDLGREEKAGEEMIRLRSQGRESYLRGNGRVAEEIYRSCGIKSYSYYVALLIAWSESKASLLNGINS